MSQRNNLMKLKEAEQYARDNALRTLCGYDFITVVHPEERVLDRHPSNKFNLEREVRRGHPDEIYPVGTVDGIINPRKVEMPSPEVVR